MEPMDMYTVPRNKRSRRNHNKSADAFCRTCRPLRRRSRNYYYGVALLAVSVFFVQRSLKQALTIVTPHRLADGLEKEGEEAAPENPLLVPENPSNPALSNTKPLSTTTTSTTQKFRIVKTKDTPPESVTPVLTPDQLKKIHNDQIEQWKAEGIFYNYSQPAIPVSTTIPLPSARYPNDTLIVLCLSSRSHFANRQAIRQTWAQGHSVYFIVGGVATPHTNETKTVQEQLVNESHTYGDVIDVILPESYMSLPYKVHFGYQWVIRNQPNVEWILKTDDDMVARISTLQRALLDLYNPEQPIVMGHIGIDALAHRAGKWAEYQYIPRKYPYFPLGSCGHVVSRPVAAYLASQPNLVYYQGEDTSVGIWLNESPLDVWWMMSPFFKNSGRCTKDDYLVIGHQLKPKHMIRCFAKGDEWNDQLYLESRRTLLFLQNRNQRHAAAAAQIAAHKPSLLLPHRNNTTTTTAAAAKEPNDI